MSASAVTLPRATPRIGAPFAVRATDVAIIGAGPYGLSIAAHLRRARVEFQIFGRPMEIWRERMPAGMFLKSEGFASDLYDPDRSFTLAHYCAEHGIPHAHSGLPIARATLAAYGMAFQRKFVAELEEQNVVALAPASGGFAIELDNEEQVFARRAIIAAGQSYFSFVPHCLAALPAEYVTHSSDHCDVQTFKGKHVTIVGGGASAVDLALELRDAGAGVSVVARQDKIHFVRPPDQNRTLRQRLRRPESGLGFGLRTKFYESAPMLFRYAPERTRIHIVNTFLGPAGSWHAKDRFEREVGFMGGQTPQYAEVREGRVHLSIVGRDGEKRQLTTDHVIAATGYKVALERLPFLSKEFRLRSPTINGNPTLTSAFESPVRGLYFVGLPAAKTFGPVMRFMVGAHYTARRMAQHLARASAQT